MNSNLSVTDLRFVVSRIPRDVRDVMHLYNLVLGGGFIRELIAGGEVRDIDLFGENKNVLRVALEALATLRSDKGYKTRIHNTDNADTLFTEGKLPVQTINRWLYENSDLVISSFDFTVCAAAVWQNHDGTWTSTCHMDFYKDLAARRLVYTHPERNEDAGGSLLRAIKFVKRGYNIQMPSLAGVVARLSVGVRQNAMASDEEGLTKIYAGLLREVDPAIAVDGIDPIDPVSESE